MMDLTTTSSTNIQILYPLSSIASNSEDLERAVVTDERIERDITFGPFPGQDATDLDFNKWMQNITTVSNLEESNLVIGIHKKSLYFKCIRVIYDGTELIVWGGQLNTHLCDESKWSRAGIDDNILTFLCQDCDMIFTSSHLLIIHWNSEHRRKEFEIPNQNCKCPCCPKIVPNKRNFRYHVLRHGICYNAHLQQKKTNKKRKE